MILLLISETGNRYHLQIRSNLKGTVQQIITKYSFNGTLEDFIEIHRHYFITKLDLHQQ